MRRKNEKRQPEKEGDKTAAEAPRSARRLGAADPRSAHRGRPRRPRKRRAPPQGVARTDPPRTGGSGAHRHGNGTNESERTKNKGTRGLSPPCQRGKQGATWPSPAGRGRALRRSASAAHPPAGAGLQPRRPSHRRSLRRGGAALRPKARRAQALRKKSDGTAATPEGGAGPNCARGLRAPPGGSAPQTTPQRSPTQSRGAKPLTPRPPGR